MASLGWATIGSEVEVMDPDGTWHVAIVKEERVERSRREIWVHYPRGQRSWDHWVRKPSLVRTPVGEKNRVLENIKIKNGTNVGHKFVDGELVCEVERIIAERWRGGKQEFRIRWATGENKTSDSWEPADNILDESLIDDFERRKRHQPEKTATPYVLQVAAVAQASPEVAAQRCEDAACLEERLGREAVKKLEREKKGSTCPRLVFDTICYEPDYVALHARLRKSAKALKLKGDASKHVTAIVSKAGGHGGIEVLDAFKVVSSEIVDHLLEPYNAASGALYVRRKRVALALVGPLTFKFLTRREPGAKRRLRVLGHYAGLRKTPEGPKWELPKFTEKKPAWAQAHKIAVATAARRLPEGQLPEGLVDFVHGEAGQLLA